MVGTYDSLGKRPSARPQLGRPGTNEDMLAGYTGLRFKEATYVIGPNLTDTTANTNRIVNGVAIGTPGTIRNLTIINAFNGLPRVSLPVPIALNAQLTAAAAPTGTHAVTVRVTGTNQFGEPTQEDFSLTAAAGGAGTTVLGVRIFQTIASAQIITESNTSSSDTVLVFFATSTNAVLGLPVRVRAQADLVGVEVGLEAAGTITYFDALQNGIAGNAAVVSVKEQSVQLTGLSDAFVTLVTLRCRTSLGMDQGLRSGDKFQKQW